MAGVCAAAGRKAHGMADRFTPAQIETLKTPEGWVECPVCHGFGRLPTGDWVEPICETCGGHGVYPKDPSARAIWIG